MLSHLLVVGRRKIVFVMATVPDDLDRQHTRITMNLEEAFQGSLDLGELFLNIIGRDLPVGIRAVHRLAMNPRTALIAILSVDVIPAPANHHKEGQILALIKSVLALCFLHQFPNVVNDGRQPFSPFESSINGTDLGENIVLGLQQVSKGKSGTGTGFVMIVDQRKAGVTNDDAVDLAFLRAYTLQFK